jgi:hypothetical protein
MANAKNSMTGRHRMTPTVQVHHPIVNRSRFAAATAISAVGLLMIPTPARAGPMLPLAPPCSQFGFTGGFSIRQANGFQVFFSSTGPVAAGKAVAVGADNVTKLAGPVSGGIKGRNVDFTIRWDGGGSGIYTGTVGDDGLVHGNTRHDAVRIDSGSAPAPSRWDSTSPLGCLDLPPMTTTTTGPPAPIPASKPVPAPVIPPMTTTAPPITTTAAPR